MVTVNLGGPSTKTKIIKYSVVAVLLAAIGVFLKFAVLNRQAYLVPVHTIAVGESLNTQQWRSVNLNLGPLATRYFDSAHRPTGFALQALASGNLVAKKSVTAVRPNDFVRLVISSKTELTAAVHPGSIVSIWSSQRLSGNQFDVPKRLAAAVSVTKLLKQQGVFSSKAQQVEVLINPLQAPSVMAAMASDSPIFFVSQE